MLELSFVCYKLPSFYKSVSLEQDALSKDPFFKQSLTLFVLWIGLTSRFVFMSFITSSGLLVSPYSDSDFLYVVEMTSVFIIYICLFLKY